MTGLKILVLSLLSLSFISCIRNSEEIYDEMKSGLVLIKVERYQVLTFPNGEKMYFTGLESDGSLANVTSSVDSIISSTAYGSGFFVSDRGEIVTAHHVITTKTNEEEVRNVIRAAIDYGKSALNDEYNQMSELLWQLNIRQVELYEGLYSDNWEDDWENQLFISALEEQMEEHRQRFRDLTALDPDRFDVSGVTVVSVAYNDTHISNDSDFTPCVVTKEDEENDLAVLQLKDKATPLGKYVFPIPSKDPLENYSFCDDIIKQIQKDKNEQLYLLGFNLGPSLALTSEGLMAQINQGNISQKQPSRLMYSIPALPGSSGAPVVNSRGELVAVNNAGLSNTQSFNYGVRINKLHNLLDQK